MTDAEYHQLQLERLQMLEEAFDRAYNGRATGEDWDILRYECGLTVPMRKENHVFNSESRI
jgi:hypothetical protein